MIDETPMRRRDVQIARKTIIESFKKTARERGSLGISFMTTYGPQRIRAPGVISDGLSETEFINYTGTLIRIRELLPDGNHREFCVDYYGSVHSDSITINRTKLLPPKNISNSRIRTDKILDLWNPETLYGDQFDEEPSGRIRVESYELPTETATAFRVSHHHLLIGFYHSDALQLTRWSRRKTILVSETETASPNRLHTIDEISRKTFEEASARHGVGNIPNKVYFDIQRRLKRIETILNSSRRNLF